MRGPHCLWVFCCISDECLPRTEARQRTGHRGCPPREKSALAIHTRNQISASYATIGRSPIVPRETLSQTSLIVEIASVTLAITLCCPFSQTLPLQVALDRRMAVILVFVPVGLLARFRAVSRAQTSAAFWVCGAAVGRQTALDALMHGEDERGTGRAVLCRRARQSR